METIDAMNGLFAPVDAISVMRSRPPHGADDATPPADGGDDAVSACW
jgi:hypothetical protein